MPPQRINPIARFWPKVQKTPTCWLWVAGKTHFGYGRFTAGGVGSQIDAHRFSWELHHGPIPAGMHVCHHCDTPACVNPGHLFLGTHSDNMRDASQKGRLKSGRTHCRRGHAFTPENTLTAARGRECLACRRQIAREHYRTMRGGSVCVRRTRAEIDAATIDVPADRASTCRRGHPLTPENTYVFVDRAGHVCRHCRACRDFRLRRPAAITTSDSVVGADL